MNAKLIGGGIVAVVAVAAGVYFGVLRDSGGGEQATSERVEKIFASIKAKGGEVTYKTANASGRGLVLTDVVVKAKDPSGKPNDVTIGEIKVNDFDWENPKEPSVADVEYKQLRIPTLTDNPGFKEFSTVTGQSDLVINAKFNFRYDKGSKTIEIKTGDAELEGLGTLSITAKIEGIDIAQLEGMATPDPGKMMGMMAAIRLHGLRIAYKDAGGTAKMMKFGAHKEKKSEADIKQGMLTQLGAAKAMPFKIARDAAAAAESFINKPGTFTIEAKPSAPFAFAQLMSLMGKPDPAAIDKLTTDLGLSVTAN